jgi:hypothetical protein
MLRDFSIEKQSYWQYFGERYLFVDDFINLCDLVGLRSCSKHELESYESRKLMFPAARTVMPYDYATAFWAHQLGQSQNFEFNENYLPFHNLDWELRYHTLNPNEQDFRHPIDRFWGIDGLEKPMNMDFIPWDSYTVNIQLGDRVVKESTVSYFYHYWQIYELYDVRKYHNGMYSDYSPVIRFGNPNHNETGELAYFFEALSYFYTLYSANYSRFFEGLQPNKDRAILLDQSQQNNLTQIIQTVATETTRLFNLDEDSLYQGLRQMMELHYDYEQAERFKLSLALKKDIWRFSELISYSTGRSPEEISRIAGPVGTYIGYYLEILFPNRRKVAREEALQLLKHLLKEYTNNFPNIRLSDAQLTSLLNYTEATSIAWFEYVIVELNNAFFERHTLHATITFLHLKAIASLPEALMKALIQNNGDQQTQQDLSNQRNPGMGNVIDLVFRNLPTTVLGHYHRINHWEARDSTQFSANLAYLANAINSATSEDEYIGTNLTLATLIRNFSSHVAVDDPVLLEGQYVLCLRSILVTVNSIWKTAHGKHWVQ